MHSNEYIYKILLNHNNSKANSKYRHAKVEKSFYEENFLTKSSFKMLENNMNVCVSAKLGLAEQAWA